ncbi:carbohydrate ABC transporter permease [Planosporangium thailandense]|uniref:Carbohydrate ABC transporter permease n=1 Tax=Planosporangium thailandense TaxID=765197 RepID=A0ABX0XTG0_9ACTN|nr:carbohydrate ABC transporter permease [Planosporangium thailandense]NJC68524.1 carbohydrate ABC transporter permease [Planosporangium thailandense]
MTRVRVTPGRVLFYLVLLVLTVIFVAPLLWMVSTSFKTNNDATALPLSWLPRPFTADAYSRVLTTASETPVLRWFVNSLAAGVGNTALIVAFDALAAYALARMRFPGRNLIFGVIVSTLFVPPFLFLIPNYLIVSRLGWLDSLLAVIVPSAGGAFGVFFLRQFFLSLPLELEEAALLEGANRWQIFTRIVLPLARPALATLTVLSFLTNWNDFVWPIYVLFNPAHETLPAGLGTLQNAATTNYPIMMAGAVVASVPVIALFIVAQRHVIQSVAHSGLKG